MVKRFVPLLAALAGAFLLTSCYMMSVRPTGTISLNFGATAGRAISPTAAVRVYLYTYNSADSYSLFTFPGGTTYEDFQYGSGSVTISEVPIGLWQVLVSVGTNVNGLLETAQYGQSQVVNVSAGVNTSVSITTKPAAFAYSATLAGQSLNGIVYDYNSAALTNQVQNLLVSGPASLYYITPSGPVPNLSTDLPTSVSVPAGLQIQSLSDGISSSVYVATGGYSTFNYSVYLNSNEAIAPLQLGVLDTSTFSASLVDSGGSRYTILDSAALSSTTNWVTYYIRSQGLGGVAVDGITNTTPFDPATKSGANWVDVDLSNQGTGRQVYALSVDHPLLTGNLYAYFATSVGAFRAAPALFDATQAGAGNLNNAVFISGPNNETIHALAVDDHDGVIYIGTSQGAYYATLTESSKTSAISGGWTPIPETMGDDIVDITADAPNYSGVAAAFRSKYNLYVLNDPPGLGGTVKVFPFNSGLPGSLNSMIFVYGTLYLVGSEGLASLYVNLPSAG